MQGVLIVYVILNFKIEIPIFSTMGDGVKFIFLKHENKVSTWHNFKFRTPCWIYKMDPQSPSRAIWLENGPLSGPFLSGPSRSCGPCGSVVTQPVKTNRKLTLTVVKAWSACATRAI